MASRRHFLASAAAVSAASLLSRAGAMSAGDGSDAKELASDPMRPQFHLLPARNWMNDPNAPIYFRGLYHMFFQYNPHAAVWGDMSWNHAVSRDMLHWTHLPIALAPTPGGPDSYGCFSGSALEVGKRVYVFYTGTRESTPELTTIKDGQGHIQESQCVAWSDDPRLIRWQKDPQPIVPLPPPGMEITGFRDPSVWKQDGAYYMTVGSGIARVGGCVLLYRSQDLKHWSYLHPLTSGRWNGQHTANPCDDGEMWECPDFFELDGGHVLIYSTLGKVFWQSGALDRKTLRFTGGKSGWLDLDAFYAPKTQLDAQGRRILWGWIRERRSDAAMERAGWSGMMSLPRVLRLDRDGTLRMQFLPQTATLRSGSIAPEKADGGERLRLRGCSGEFVGAGEKGSDFSLSLRSATASSSIAAEILAITYSAKAHAFLLDGETILLRPDDVPELHGFVDGSVVEVLLGGRMGCSKRFYYAAATAPDLYARVQGKAATIRGWTVAAISPDRLTREASAT